VADDYFPEWYSKHSTVYVAKDHQVFLAEKSRRVRKKHGKLVRSEKNDIIDILEDAKGDVIDKIRGLTRSWTDEEERKQNDADGRTARLTGMYQPQATPYSFAQNMATPPHGQYAQHNSMQMGQIGGGYLPHSEIPMRENPSGSPNPSVGGLRSPQRLPVMGMFHTTTPERVASQQRSPERVGASPNPMMGSPSRRY
jgi:hypothetical protein